jgi:hypothetical protein
VARRSLDVDSEGRELVIAYKYSLVLLNTVVLKREE